VGGIDLSVSRGECVAILGRNGAGKSSTFKALVGAVRRAGEVTFDGQSIGRLKTDAIARAGVAWVPEERRIFPDLTVRENLMVAFKSAPVSRRIPMADLIEQFGMLQKLLDRKGGALSGGQQQMVAVARAMASGPRLLLLDEPSEGLAPVVTEQLTAQLSQLRLNFHVSMLIAEQNMAFVEELSSRVYILERGRVVHESGTEELARSADLQKKYLSAGLSTEVVN
jgi:branched-chain amino acid transport system ATP-binding protein